MRKGKIRIPPRFGLKNGEVFLIEVTPKGREEDRCADYSYFKRIEEK
jgi:hypothetical protein